jgi:hypothetical protein
MSAEPVVTTSPARVRVGRRLEVALRAAAVAAVLVGAGCGEDAVSDGVAPDSDGAPPQDDQPQDNEQEAPNADDADLSGDEEPAVGEDGFSEDTEAQD